MGEFIIICLAIYDVITNIYLVIELLSNEDDLSNTLLIYAILISIFCIILRITLNMIYCYTLPQSISYNIYATNWYKKYKNKFICLALLSGGNCYSLLLFTSSNLLGIEFTNNGISKLEMKYLYYRNNKILINGLFIECVPMLIVQIIYFKYISYQLEAPLIMAFVSTFIFTIIYIILCIVNCKRERNNDYKICLFYYIEIHFKSQLKIMYY